MPHRTGSGRRTILKTVGAGVTVGLAGCMGNGDDDNGASDSDTSGSDDIGDEQSDDDMGGEVEIPNPLRIGHPSPAMAGYSVPTYSLFNEEMESRGVEIEPVVFNGFTAMVAGIVSGEVELGYSNPPAIINSIREGFPISSFLELNQKFSQQIIAQPDIESWEELEGAPVAAHSPQSFSALTLRATAESQLGDPEAFDLSYIAGTPNRISAMEEEEVDATTVFASAAIDVEERDIAQWFHNPNDDVAAEPLSLAQWVTTDDRLNEYEEVYRTIAEELTNSYEQAYETDPQELAEMIFDSPAEFPAYDSGDIEVWEQTIEAAQEDEMWETDMSNMLTDERVSRSIDLAERTGLIDEVIEVDDLVDRRFLE
ncbi:hypothetical protein EA462_13535 [Natrarchaeobius halalkaliphilus]|uniref:SsuA/THI5-like domain-containing protein n=1 Tax=Natrarchaeobius halalkaliphilus TaxID=1679091 RepID=A0A3N6LLB8_9EURY|nr:ABC transporter substrate-binding protein [Natrarchaeobius halalkaliphilus]RQG87880.1 hypothetical protein EA462_13535 [Natrarchaeobius halalkaliphilus]